jgi:succinoglycan biosynthesis transport protein ExoP
LDNRRAHTYPAALGALRVLRRQWWIVILTTVLVAGLAVFMAMRQPAQYQSSSSVLLKFQSLASGLTGIQDQSTVYQDATRVTSTQTQIAMSPAVVDRVEKSLGDGQPLGSVSVTAASDSDLLYFTVTGGNAYRTQRVATVYAEEYVAYRKELDTSALVAARLEIRGRIDELEQTELKNTNLVANLIEKEQQLRTMEALQTSNASLLRAAGLGYQIQPKPKRNAVLGIVLGLMLGIGLVFARKALDTRVRVAGDVDEALGLPMLGRIPAPPKKVQSAGTIVMLAKPNGHDAEAFRVLRSNLDFVNLDRGARTIMVTSALEREGKSTTVANLAVVLAQAGRRVALVDLDLRRPALQKFFGLDPGQPGLTSVVLGRETLDSTLIHIVLGGASSPATPSANGGTAPSNGSGHGDGARAHATPGGSLHVLPAGLVPPNPGEFCTSPRLDEVLRELAERNDVVLIDTPPLLSVGDAIALSAKVDGMFCVTRLNLLRRQNLEELDRALTTCPTIKLGYVVTGADKDDDYAYYTHGYYGRGFDYDVPPGASAPHRETVR